MDRYNLANAMNFFGYLLVCAHLFQLDFTYVCMESILVLSRFLHGQYDLFTRLSFSQCIEMDILMLALSNSKET